MTHTAPIPPRWLIVTLLMLAGLVALGTLWSLAVAAQVDPSITWILSSELLAPALVAILAITLYLQRTLQHKRRHLS